MINQNIQAKYLNNPQNCPHCDSENMTASTIYNDTKTNWRNIQCLDCNQEWREVYQLDSIEEVD